MYHRLTPKKPGDWKYVNELIERKLIDDIGGHLEGDSIISMTIIFKRAAHYRQFDKLQELYNMESELWSEYR